jgi:hypothetical protein
MRERERRCGGNERVREGGRWLWREWGNRGRDRGQLRVPPVRGERGSTGKEREYGVTVQERTGWAVGLNRYWAGLAASVQFPFLSFFSSFFYSFLFSFFFCNFCIIILNPVKPIPKFF